MNKSRKPGFTLVEMLVVIAIIALLLALLMPVMRAVRLNMRAAQCLNNVKQLHHALKMYERDFGRLPPSHGQVSVNTAYGTGVNPTWIQGDSGVLATAPKQGLLWKYYGQDPALVICPIDNTPGVGNGVFSYSMPIIAGMKSSQQALNAANTLIMIQENPQLSIGATADGSFSGTDLPDTSHNRLTTTLWLDGHAELRDWAEYNGLINYPRLATTYPALPIATDIALPPWGYNTGPGLADY